MIYYQAQPQLLRLSPSPFLPLRVFSSFLTQTDSINSLSDLSLTLTSRVTHTPKKKKKKTGVEFFPVYIHAQCHQASFHFSNVL